MWYGFVVEFGLWTEACYPSALILGFLLEYIIRKWLTDCQSLQLQKQLAEIAWKKSGGIFNGPGFTAACIRVRFSRCSKQERQECFIFAFHRRGCLDAQVQFADMNCVLHVVLPWGQTCFFHRKNKPFLGAQRNQLRSYTVRRFSSFLTASKALTDYRYYGYVSKFRFWEFQHPLGLDQVWATPGMNSQKFRSPEASMAKRSWWRGLLLLAVCQAHMTGYLETLKIKKSRKMTETGRKWWNMLIDQ